MVVQKAGAKQVGGGLKRGAHGSFFERLQAVSDLHYDDSADDAAYQVVLDEIGECERLVRAYESANGYHSAEVRSAIGEWARAFLEDLGATRDQLRDGHDVVVQARGAMRQARDLFKANVSGELLTGGERGWRIATDGAGAVALCAIPVVGAVAMVASELYWSSLEKERHREREEYCQNVLEQMNASLNEGAGRMQGVIDKGGEANDSRISTKHPAAPPLPGVVDPNLMAGAGGPGGGSGAGGAYGSGAGGLGGDGSTGLGGDGSTGPGGDGSAGGVVLAGRDWASEGFARPGAVQDPPPYARLSDVDGVGLVGRPVNQTVTPNGLVGGYAPPSAVHASDPRWDPSYRIPQDALSAGRAASSGALGALAGGAAVSARSLLSAAAGAKGTVGLGAAGAAGAKGAAGPGAGGLKGGAAAAGGAGGMMGMGAPVAGAGAGAAGEDKKKRRAGGATVREEEETGPVWDPAHGPGSADDDIVLVADWDEWEEE